MWKDLLLFPVVFICSVIIVSLSVLGLFSIDSFLSFILRSSVCMYIHNTKIFQQKNCKKKMVYFKTNSRHVCLCVCMRVRMAAAALTQFFFWFFFSLNFGRRKQKRQFQKKNSFPQGRKKIRPIICINIFFLLGHAGGPRWIIWKKKKTNNTKKKSEIPSLERNL